MNFVVMYALLMRIVYLKIFYIQRFIINYILNVTCVTKRSCYVIRQGVTFLFNFLATPHFFQKNKRVENIGGVIVC